MFVTVIALKYALLVSHCSYGHFLKLTDSVLFEYHDKSSPFNSTHYIVSCPQNGDRIVTIASVTLLFLTHTRVVHGSILCDQIQPNPLQVGKFEPNPTQPNSY